MVIRRILSGPGRDLLRQVAEAGRPLAVTALSSPWSESSLDELLERELVREVSRAGDQVTIEVTERGLIELSL